MANVTMRQMLEAGVHFGHQTRYWNPKMAPYIFGERNKIHIINLEKTLPMYLDAVNYLGKMAANGGKVLFVGTKRSARDAIREGAEQCGMPYVNHRWLGGMLTNFHTVKQSIKRLADLDQMIESDNSERLGKREILSLQRERDKLNKSLGGIRNMSSLPDVLFLIDVGYEEIAVKEARKLGIPVVAVVDTNHSLQGVDYVIPGNDDAIRAIKLYVSNVAEAINDAKQSAQILSGDEEEFVEVSDEKEAAGSDTAAEQTAEKVSIKKKAKEQVVEPEPVAEQQAQPSE